VTLQFVLRYGERPVTEVEARRLAAQSGAAGYVECSALTQHNLKEVFDQAIVAGLRHQARNHPRVVAPVRPLQQKPTPGKHKQGKPVSLWRKLCCCM
jgi:Ras family protein U